METRVTKRVTNAMIAEYKVRVQKQLGKGRKRRKRPGVVQGGKIVGSNEQKINALLTPGPDLRKAPKWFRRLTIEMKEARETQEASSHGVVVFLRKCQLFNKQTCIKSPEALEILGIRQGQEGILV